MCLVLADGSWGEVASIDTVLAILQSHRTLYNSNNKSKLNEIKNHNRTSVYYTNYIWPGQCSKN